MPQLDSNLNDLFILFSSWFFLFGLIDLSTEDRVIENASISYIVHHFSQFQKQIAFEINCFGKNSFFNN